LQLREHTLSHSAVAPGGDRPRRVLIVRIGAMGDILHAMPAVAALRELHPEWFIGWVVEPAWSVLLQSSTDLTLTPYKTGRSPGRPLVDQWHPFPAREWRKRLFAFSTLKEIHMVRRELWACEDDVCV